MQQTSMISQIGALELNAAAAQAADSALESLVAGPTHTSIAGSITCSFCGRIDAELEDAAKLHAGPSTRNRTPSGVCLPP